MTSMLHEMLGLAEAPADGLAWHDVLSQGLDAQAVRLLARNLGVTQTQLVELAMPGARFERKKRLPQEASNFLYRVGQALCRLLPTMQGDMRRAAQWLRVANPALRGQIPILLLQTHLGAEFVFTAIARLTPELPARRDDAESDEPEAEPEESASQEESAPGIEQTL